MSFWHSNYSTGNRSVLEITYRKYLPKCLIAIMERPLLTLAQDLSTDIAKRQNSSLLITSLLSPGFLRETEKVVSMVVHRSAHCLLHCPWELSQLLWEVRVLIPNCCWSCRSWVRECREELRDSQPVPTLHRQRDTGFTLAPYFLCICKQ